MYSKLIKVYDMQDCIDLLYQNTILNTNIKLLKKNRKQTFGQGNFFDIEDYILSYDSNLKDIEKKYKGKKNIKSFIIELEHSGNKNKQEKNEMVKKTVEYLSENSIKINYISFYIDKKISILIFDRYFYPKGKVIEIRAKSNYKDGTQKGEIIKKEKIILSHKFRIFNYSSDMHIEQHFKILKYLLKSKKKVKTVKFKVLKKLNENEYIQIQRTDDIYEKWNEYKYRRIRALNILIRAMNLKVVNITKEEVYVLKKALNDHSMKPFEYENEIFKKLNK